MSGPWRSYAAEDIAAVTPSFPRPAVETSAYPVSPMDNSSCG